MNRKPLQSWWHGVCRSAQAAKPTREAKLRAWWRGVCSGVKPFRPGDPVTFGPSKKPGVVDRVFQRGNVRIRVGKHCIIRPAKQVHREER